MEIWHFNFEVLYSSSSFNSPSSTRMKLAKIVGFLDYCAFIQQSMPPTMEWSSQTFKKS